MRVVVLGSGGSMGVPVVGCNCSTCLSLDGKNKRLRSSVLLIHKGKRILIDSGPDLREQALRSNIDHIDGLLLTHTHYDHSSGIYELRAYIMGTGRALPCLLSQESLEQIDRSHPYLRTIDLDFIPLKGDAGEVHFCGINIKYLSYSQSGMKVTGFVVDKFAYLTDIKEFDNVIFQYLQGIDLLFISARTNGSAGHMGFPDAVAFARNTSAKKVYFIHLDHLVDSDSVKLPPGFELTYDGLEVIL